MSSPLIELEGVTKLYKTVIGVNDITLTLAPGFYGLLGPNGSGKTTLINLIMGQLRPTLGCVRLFGEEPWAHDRLLREVGLCPANEIHLPRVSAFTWVSYLLKLMGFSAREARSRAEAALATVKMERAMHRPVNEYSLGMRQRTKLAQAIAHDPQLLILDEPFNGLDPVGRHDMLKMLDEWRAKGRSLIFASHLLHEVEAIRPSFLLISGGRLLASGPPQEVRRILAESPSLVRIRCEDVRPLAAALVKQGHAVAVRISADHQHIEVQTPMAAALYEQLPELAHQTGTLVEEIQSTDDSLKELFTSLMRRHRGEV